MENSGNAGERYLDAAKALLTDLWESQSQGIERAAAWIAETLQRDSLIFVAGSGHSHMLAEELFYRAGGLAAVVPLLESSLMLHDGAVKSSGVERLEGYAAVVIEDAGVGADDLLIIASNSGRNAYPVELALEARARGCRTIAVTSLATAERVESRHSSGGKLARVADLVLDNRVAYGDATIDVIGLPSRVGPLSTIAGVALLNAAVVRAIELCVEQGYLPDVFESANLQEAGGAAGRPDEVAAGLDLFRWRRRVRRL
ncbi:MAG TPA: SIS domain-containing protein [Trueperaceae bacterium]|nr:SIS domain-containing protein [Trueperaceae bacterium]